LVTLALGLSPAAAYAAGLGRLTIQSGIGQPLLGEIELVSVRPDELSTLAARIAPPEAYRNASINFNSALMGARATIERRQGGAPYIRIVSSRPIEEPFIDLLVELTWNTGRLVREYTALVDPPGFGSSQVATPSAVPDSRPAPAAPVAAPRTAGAAAPPAEGGERTYGPVQPGDTLRKIAGGVKPEGVSVDQVLVGIYRSNPDAFINNNMNLLRSGRILRIPDPAELGKVPGAEAGNEVRTHATDWNAYRARAAGAVPEIAAADTRSATGKITTRTDEAAPGAPPGKEVVKVSKGAPGKEAAGDATLQERIRVLEEEATAREKTLKDANERIAALEKTLKDMQRLLELKSVPVPPPVAVAPPAEKIEPAQPPVETAKPEAPAVVPPPVAEVKPEAALPAPEPKPEAKKAEAAPPPPAEQWWEDPALLGGALLALGLVGGLAYALSRRRRGAEDRPAAEPSLRTPPAAEPETVPAFAAPAAAAAPVASATTEMPATPAAAADDVDPIQEADVYIAYGRDAQAEEILKEALAKHPNRLELKLKLLEIYAARKSRNDFNALANDLHNTTGGRGETWLKTATMGFALDPENPLYAAGKDSAFLPPLGVATDVNLDFDLDMVTAAGAPTTVTDVPLDAGEDQTVKTMALSPERMEALRAEGAGAAARPATDTHSIVPDIDLTDTHTAPRTDITLEPASPSGPITDVNLDVPRTSTDSNVIDFEFDPGKTMKIEPGVAAAFGHDQTIIISPENQVQARDLGVEIDLGALDTPAPGAPAGTVVPPTTADTTADISFDFELPSEPTADVEVPPTDVKLDVPEQRQADITAVDFALDTVSLDLGSADRTAEMPAAPVHDDHWYDVQTKFDLAKAYQEMGDKEGAREILAEVIKEGDAQQQAEANELLAKL
jgi:pilus assembly protein FimV